MTLKNTEPFIMFISTCILWLFTFVELSFKFYAHILIRLMFLLMTVLLSSLGVLNIKPLLDIK